MMRGYLRGIGRGFAGRGVKGLKMRDHAPTPVQNKPHVAVYKGRTIKRIVAHCTASSTTATVTSILTYWKTPKGPKGCKYIPNVQGGKGWRSTGYHFLIDRDAEIHLLLPIEKIANGVRYYNSTSVHISYIGGRGGVDNRTEAQKAAMKQLIDYLRSPDMLGPLPVVGHRDLAFTDYNKNGKADRGEWHKACPSFEVSDWLKSVGISQ